MTGCGSNSVSVVPSALRTAKAGRTGTHPTSPPTWTQSGPATRTPELEAEPAPSTTSRVCA